MHEKQLVCFIPIQRKTHSVLFAFCFEISQDVRRIQKTQNVEVETTKWLENQRTLFLFIIFEMIGSRFLWILKHLHLNICIFVMKLSLYRNNPFDVVCFNFRNDLIILCVCWCYTKRTRKWLNGVESFVGKKVIIAWKIDSSNHKNKVFYSNQLPQKWIQSFIMNIYLLLYSGFCSINRKNCFKPKYSHHWNARI